jgi:hypothetical protein
VVTSVEELERALLHAPWDKWAVFLHPKQALISRRPTTPSASSYALPARARGIA